MMETHPQNQPDPHPEAKPENGNAPENDAATPVIAPEEIGGFIAQLDVYKGPLDLLLYLIRENEVDIRDIPIGSILDQYMIHLEVIRRLDINRAGDFLLLASKLLEIKSRMVLPVAGEASVDLDELEDPRDELVLQLLEYQRMKRAARALRIRGKEWEKRMGRDQAVHPKASAGKPEEIEMEIGLFRLIQAFESVVKKTLSNRPAVITHDGATVEEKIEIIRDAVIEHRKLAFIQLFTEASDRWDVVATFLAILHLTYYGLIRIMQSADFGEIFIEYRGEERIEAEEQAVETAEKSGGDEANTPSPRAEEKSAKQSAAAGKEKDKSGKRPEQERFDAEEFNTEPIMLEGEDRKMDEKVGEILARAEEIENLMAETKAGRNISPEYIDKIISESRIRALSDVPISGLARPEEAAAETTEKPPPAEDSQDVLLDGAIMIGETPEDGYIGEAMKEADAGAEAFFGDDSDKAENKSQEMKQQTPPDDSPSTDPEPGSAPDSDDDAPEPGPE